MTTIQTTVFGLTAAGGNPCPVVLDADALDTQRMRAMAAEFGAETAFVLHPDRPGAHVRLRYFVPEHEMEMCVHATVAATTILVGRGELAGNAARVETPLGVIPVGWEQGHDGLDVTVEQFPAVFSTRNPGTAEVATALRIPLAAVELAAGPVESVSASRPKLLVPLADRAVLDNLRPDFERLWALCDEYATTGVYPFTLTPGDDTTDVEARQFPKRAGYDEDPATGVAAAALAAYLTHHAVLRRPQPGWREFRIGQGRAMGRPSLLTAAALVQDGRITSTRITGRATVAAAARERPG